MVSATAWTPDPFDTSFEQRADGAARAKKHERQAEQRTRDGLPPELLRAAGDVPVAAQARDRDMMLRRRRDQTWLDHTGNTSFSGWKA